MTDKVITIFGSGRTKPGDGAFALAFNTGKSLAEAGFIIANGGYGGTMLAAAKGAREAGGEVIGITCSAFNSKANEYVSKEIAKPSLDERLDKLIALGAAYVVLPGGTGTLLELAKVWEYRNKGFLSQAKPIIIVGDFWKDLLDTIDRDDACGSNVIEKADDPKELIALLNKLLF